MSLLPKLLGGTKIGLGAASTEYYFKRLEQEQKLHIQATALRDSASHIVNEALERNYQNVDNIIKKANKAIRTAAYIIETTDTKETRDNAIAAMLTAQNALTIAEDTKNTAKILSSISRPPPYAAAVSPPPYAAVPSRVADAASASPSMTDEQYEEYIERNRANDVMIQRLQEQQIANMQEEKKAAEEAARRAQEAARRAQEAERRAQEAERREQEEAARIAQEAERREQEEAARIAHEEEQCKLNKSNSYCGIQAKYLKYKMKYKNLKNKLKKYML
jgi:hypothetical protein